MPTATVTSKGQVTIPKKIRDRLNLKPGDSVDFEIDQGNNVLLIPSKRNPEETYGILYRKNQEALTIEQMDEGVQEYFKRKYRAE